MKRAIALVIIMLILSILFTGCGGVSGDTTHKTPDTVAQMSDRPPGSEELIEPNNLWTVKDGITIRLKQDRYPPGTEIMTLIFENHTDSDYVYGFSWSIEKFEDGQWRELDTGDIPISWPALGYVLNAHDTATRTIQFMPQHERLDVGFYRVSGIAYSPYYQLEFVVSDSATPEWAVAESPDMAELDGLLIIGNVFSTGFHMGFTLHNISDVTLYYDAGFELYRDVGGKWELELSQDGDVIYSLDPGITRNYGNEWSDVLWKKGEQGYVELTPGRYIFTRKIYTNLQDTSIFKHLRIEFTVIARNDTVTARPNWRQDRINFALLSEASENIVLAGEVNVSRNSVAFSLENRSDRAYTYGLGWDLARYYNGRWQPVPYLPVAGDGVPVPSLALGLRSGGIQREYFDWSGIFGELPTGRYMFIREYNPSDEYPLPDRRYTVEYAMVLFEIEENSPKSLPPQDAYRAHVMLVEYRDVTSTGMTAVIENVSEYDFEFHAYVGSIYQSNTAWSLRTLPEYLWPDGDEWARVVFSSGSRVEINLDWEKAFGPLPQGEYSIYINSFGEVPPPHPTGAFQEVLEALISVN